MLYNISVSGSLTDGFSEMATQIRDLSPIQMVIVTTIILLIFFIPTFLGMIRNRKHIGKIFLLNIPAMFTFTSWFLLMGIVLIKFDDFGELKNRFLNRKKESPE